MTDHTEHPLDYLPELALGVLPEAEAAPVRLHLATCDTCRLEFDEMARVTRLLPFAVEQHEPSPALKESLLSRIAAEAQAPARDPAPIVPFRRARQWALAAAAAVLLLGAGAFGGWLLRGDDAGLRDESERRGDLLAAVARGESNASRFESDGLRAAIVHASNSALAFAVVEGLPSLPGGKAYQAWFADGSGVAPGPVFSVANGSLWLEAPAELDRYTAIAFTIEDAAGARQPTQQPFAVVPLQRTARR